ncbi:MAG TPA: hypothetical protein VHC69_03450 [Polyangiaceae bacterium]|nr:hypothetical protein [Polyangiaceae bacterium]
MLERFLQRHAEAGLSAAAEALFPVNDLGAPDYRTTDVVARTLDYLRLLPSRQRTLLVCLFAFVELGAPLLLLRPARFSRLPVARREHAIRSFRASPLLPLRVVGDAIKACMTMMYMSHPAALAHVGAFRGCGRAGNTPAGEAR